MTQMESALVNCFNSYFQKNNIMAFAYRQYQSKYGKGQVVDILVDSLDREFYLAVEAKSMDATKNGTFNFKSRFDTSKDGFQLEREIAFCKLTGRTGFLALELRLGAGKPRECYMIPLLDVYNSWKAGEKSLKIVNIIRNYKKLERKNGKYIFTARGRLP